MGNLKIIPILAGLMIGLTSLFHANLIKTNDIQSYHHHNIFGFLFHSEGNHSYEQEIAFGDDDEDYDNDKYVLHLFKIFSILLLIN